MAHVAKGMGDCLFMTRMDWQKNLVNAFLVRQSHRGQWACHSRQYAVLNVDNALAS